MPRFKHEAMCQHYTFTQNLFTTHTYLTFAFSSSTLMAGMQPWIRVGVELFTRPFLPLLSRPAHTGRLWEPNYPSLTSEGLAISLPSLGSAVGSRFTCGSPWNRKGMVSLSVFSTNTKQASPQSVRFHVDIRQARTAVDSAMSFYRYIYNL